MSGPLAADPIAESPDVDGAGVPALERDRDAPAPHAVKVPAILYGDGIPHSATKRDRHLDTWKWECPACGMRSFCTFATAKEAEHYGKGHRCV